MVKIENDLKIRYRNFINEVDVEKFQTTWERQSKIFRDFWKERIMNETYPQLTDSEIDEIVLILDKNAKGSTKKTIAVARVMIPQGVWRRLFKEIKSNNQLRNLLFNILTEQDNDKQVKLINELYKLNEGQKNSLTGKSGNAINTMLFAFNPNKYTAIISLNHRKQIIDYFKLGSKVNFEKDSPGEKIVQTNKEIIEGFRKYDIEPYPYLLSKFLYKEIKEEWKIADTSGQEVVDEPEQEDDEEYSEEKSSFYMEKELENFIISNWDRTELANDYELIEEDGEMVSQQYKTDIGKIDILVIDKKSGQYVVIELKKNQTSDDTVGQLTRYMGWLEENKSNGKLTKGIIIASAYDKKLYYALKKVKDVEVYTYQVDFKLKEFKGT